MGAVTHEQYRSQAADAQQPRGFTRILDGVARYGVEEQGLLRYPAGDRDASHIFCFRDRPGTAAREYQ